MEYIDPIPHVVTLLNNAGITVYGNAFQTNPVLPAVLVRIAGGTGFTRLQLISRAEVDYEAMAHLITAINYLEKNARFIQGIRVLWIERETNPTPGIDTDTGKPEAWAYLRLEHLEA